MATVTQYLAPEEAATAASEIARYDRLVGTNFPVTVLRYSGSNTQRAFWKWSPIGYGSGNLTCDIRWYADSGTSGAVVWETAIAAITPNTDSQDVETKAFATAQTVTDTHLGTTAQRLHLATITISNLDGLAAGDEVWLRLSRLPGDAGDTMNGIDALLTSVLLSYSDT